MKTFRFNEYNEIKSILEQANLYNAEHQMHVYDLAKAIEKHLETHDSLGLELLFQTNIDREDASSKRVDVIVREKKTEAIKFVIDVCATSMVKEAYDRLTYMRVIHNIDEIFVYDYQKYTWITNNREVSSYSSLLGTDLSNFIS